MRIIVTLLSCCVLFGCSTTRPSKDQLSRIRSVTVTKAVEESVTYSGSLPSEYEIEQGNGFLAVPLLAPIGLVIELWNYPKTQKRKTQRLKEIFSQAEIDVVGSVRNTFGTLTPGLVTVSASTDAPIPINAVNEADHGPIDAEIELRISYGLSSAVGLGTDWTPWVEVDAIMKDQTGRTLWSTAVEVTVGDGGIHPLPFPDPFLDADGFRAQYEAAVDVVCRRLIADMIADTIDE